MAIYHLKAGMVCRSEGRSIVAAAAYISGTKLRDERQQMVHSYVGKGGIEHTEILAPSHAPGWVYDRERLWNEVDAAEKRSNSQTGRTFKVALPLELSDEQQLAVLRAFVSESFVARGMIADFAIHRDDPGNPHSHILLTTRTITAEGFTEKDRSWDAKSTFFQWREDWAHQCNLGFARAGLDVRIDHRSFADQGIDLVPTKHIGIPTKDVKKVTGKQRTSAERSMRDGSDNRAVVAAIEHEESRGKSGDKTGNVADEISDIEPTKHIGIRAEEVKSDTKWRSHRSYKPESKCRDKRAVIADAASEHEAILEKNGDKILSRPESALEALAMARATFTRRDIASYLASHMDAERVPLALEKVVNCGEAFYHGKDHDGNDRYSTKSNMRLEQETRELAEQLAERKRHMVPQRCAAEPSFKRRMGTEQEAAYRYLTQESGDIAVVQGYAGTGKTYLLGAAREAWEAQGYSVVGAALAAKAAQGLESEAGIKSQTIASLIKSLERDAKSKAYGDARYGHRTVLVIDEAGMVGTRDMHRLLVHAQHRGMKVALVGDTAQLEAVGAGAMMRAIAERVGDVVVSEIRRQDVAWQREATRMLGRGEAKAALELYEREGHFVRSETKSEAIDEMVKAWAEARIKEPAKSSIMLAHERADVALANTKGRDALVAAGVLKDGIEYNTRFGKRIFAEGDRLVFLKNDRELSVSNGQSGTVQQVSQDSIVVRLDGNEEREVEITVARYGYFDYGYAVTVHKSQGDTLDRVFVLGSAAYDAHLSCVALSRHSEDVRLYWSHDVFGSTAGGLIERLSSASRRNNALDYAAAHSLDATVLGTFQPDKLEAAVAEHRQSEFLLEIGALSDDQLAERMSSLSEEAKGKIVKPSELEQGEGGRLKELSAALEQAQQGWQQAAADFDRKKQDFVEQHDGDERQKHAEEIWVLHGPQTPEGQEAQREMRRAFDLREAAIAQMQRYHVESRTAQQAVEQAREQNYKLRLSRERLHLVEREIEQRRVDVLQRELDAVEFNLQQRSRMWHEAAMTSSQTDVDRAYALDGPLKDAWTQLRDEQRAASNARYELSGIVATRGAWFSPIETELPTGRGALCAAVDKARGAYQKALEGWGLWRAEHSVTEAHAARRGEGEGAKVYQTLVVAERGHQHVQRSYLERVAFEELDRAEARYVAAAQEREQFKARNREEAREAYTGEGEAGKLWKAEREAQELCARWESTYDWLARRGRHHIFPQQPGADEAVPATNLAALNLAQQWETYKRQCDDAQLHEARQGIDEGGKLYERFRVASAERQHARRELRVTKTDERVSELEHCSVAVHRELTECLDMDTCGRYIYERGDEGRLWQLNELIDRERTSTAQQLDRLLRTELIGIVSHSEYQLTEAELADNRVLVNGWLDAEQALADAAAAWEDVPDEERRRVRIGFGDEHTETYVEYREALSRRDVLREHVEIGMREHTLAKLEKKHFDAVLAAMRHSAPEHAAAEAAVNRERLHIQALFDKSAGRVDPSLHPQPEPTAERQQIVENTFYRATAGWLYWRDEHSEAEVMRARRGDPSCEGTTMYDAYRRAGIERQNIRDVLTHTAEREQRQQRAKDVDLEAALERILGKQKAIDAIARDPSEAIARLKESLDGPQEQAPRKKQASKTAERDASKLPEGSTVLYVPYEQRDEAKTHGARWHKPSKTWYAPDGADIAPLQKWTRNDALEQKPQQSFDEVLRETGLVVEGAPILDGRWHRVPVEGSRRRTRDGAYIGNIGVDGRPYGYCKNHRTGDERRWSDRGGKPLTVQQRVEIAEQKKESDIERQLRQWDRAQELKEQWEQLPEASNDHPYLQKKGVECHGLRQTEDGCLVMPLRNYAGDFWSYQTINADGDKRLAGGGRKTESFHAIGDIENARRILICEGYATGASIHRATGTPVVVAVDAGNLKPVAEGIRKLSPEAEIAIMADNDHHREVNVGVQKAAAAAKAVNGVALAAHLTDAEKAQNLTDFNDIEQSRGEASLKSLNAAIDNRFKEVAEQREAKLQAESKERSRTEMPPAQQAQQAKQAACDRSAAEQAAKAKERADKQLQRIKDEYGPKKSKGKGKKGPGHGLSL